MSDAKVTVDDRVVPMEISHASPYNSGAIDKKKERIVTDHENERMVVDKNDLKVEQTVIELQKSTFDAKKFTNPLGMMRFTYLLDRAFQPPKVNVSNKVIAGVFDRYSPIHGLFDAVHVAFAQELGLELDPAIVWACISQGIAQYVNNAPKECHKILNIKTALEEKKTKIVVRNDSLVKDENVSSATPKWAKVMPEFEKKISENLGSSFPVFLCNPFSTTTQTTDIVQKIILMDTCKQYFDYSVATMCGIAYVDRRGTKQDWQSIVSRLNTMKVLFSDYEDKFFLEWLTKLIGVMQRIVGTFDKEDGLLWESMYKYQSQSGGCSIDGWIMLLFPFDSEGKQLIKFHKSCPFACRLYSLRNFSSGMAVVPFEWDYFGEKINLKFCAGFAEPLVSAPCQGQTVPKIVPRLQWMVTD